jgi:two-component system chemotaxis response regulator CheB
LKPIRVLVVDDSRTIRQLIKAVLNSAPDITVVGEAADPIEARAAIKALSPDVITLDVEMPKMNGLDFLEKLMRLRPTPVIMVSNLTRSGEETTVEALEIGAVDCIVKPQPGDAAPFAELIGKVRIASQADFGATAPAPRQGGDAAAPFNPDGRVLAIGSSTGGVEALTCVLSSFPANCPPTLITQHMPAGFTRSFAERLNRTCAPTVREAEDGAPVLPGHVYIAPGSPTHHLELAGGVRPRCRLTPGQPVNGHCPSVDVLFRSVVKTVGGASVGLILTGMGRDGAAGLLAMRQAGAATIGQDAQSSLIYGMPKAAFEAGAVEKQVPLRHIGSEILSVMSL